MGPEGGSVVDFTYVGRGLYSISDAARLTGVPARNIRRWTRGYPYTDKRGKQWSGPAIVSDVQPPDSDVDTIFFADMMEVRFMQELRRMGVGWGAIRRAAEYAREVLHEAHPFMSRRLETDGRNILLRVQSDTGDEHLLNLVRKQYELRALIERYLRDLDFDEKSDLAARWWPLGKKRRVVIDPARAFGQPITIERIPTWVLAASARAEGSIEGAAWAYEVPTKSVKDAVAFEKKFGSRRN
jgi:uncharacterized protein (DUF433 family)